MIRSLAVAGVRGIRTGGLKDLTPLTVLVGPNGGGKSTVLEALLIGSSAWPAEAVGRAVRRRRGLSRGSRWLIHRHSDAGTVRVVGDEIGDRLCRLEWSADAAPEHAEKLLADRHPAPYDEIHSSTVAVPGAVGVAEWTAFAANNRYVPSAAQLPKAFVVPGLAESIATLNRSPHVRLVDPFDMSRPLHRTYSEAVNDKRDGEILELLRAIDQSIRRIEILAPDDEPVLNIVAAAGAVPVALAGDGLVTFLRVVIELASRPGGLALVEEPEVHQYPRTLRQTAKAVWLAVRRGVQVVLTTHSIELIDALLDEAGGPDLPDIENMSVHRVELADGEMRASRLAGDDVRFERRQIAEDLR